MKAYQSALAGEPESGKPPRMRGNPGTFDRLTQECAIDEAEA